MTSLLDATPVWFRRLARPIFYLGNNRLSQVGVVLTTASALTIISFYTADFFGVRLSPYTGILAYLILPAIFVFGLLLIPAGIYVRYRAEKKAGLLPTEYPQIDLGDTKLRETLLFVAVMTGINLALFLTASYRGVHYMDSTQFCGQTCHTVMQPEYTAYQNSPHARVACVECHIGPGASWFVRSKLSGSWQVVSVTFDLYPRPIPTPISNLRPARETCEECHWPLDFHGDKLDVKSEFQDDEENSPTKTVLLLHTGGLSPLSHKPEGIHGIHLQPDVSFEYVATDHQRQEIPYVRYTDAEGKTLEFVSADTKQTLAELRAAPRRQMDCMDCHNRPTHTFQMPGPAIDQAMAAGLIDHTLPYVKKEGLELVQLSFASQAEAASQIRTRLRDYYRDNYPAIFNSARRDSIEKAADALVGLYHRNVFPKMNIFWGTYPNDLGHDPFPGCFRCHDGNHVTADGEHTIPNDCDTCHSLLAYQEPNPQILQTLKGE